MDITTGFSLAEPEVEIRWGISEEELVDLLGGRLGKICDGYYSLLCTPLVGLSCALGFHFSSSVNGRLTELEFFQRDGRDIAQSYPEFQSAFEKAFGRPSSTTAGEEGFPYHEWRRRRVRISHSVFNRFGLEEHMRVRWHAA